MKDTKHSNHSMKRKMKDKTAEVKAKTIEKKDKAGNLLDDMRHAL